MAIMETFVSGKWAAIEKGKEKAICEADSILKKVYDVVGFYKSKYPHIL